MAKSEMRETGKGAPLTLARSIQARAEPANEVDGDHDEAAGYGIVVITGANPSSLSLLKVENVFCFDY